MQSPRARVPIATLAVASLVGTWVGHNLEYLRAWGTVRFPDAVSRSAHTYLGPIGLGLLGMAVLSLWGTVRLAGRLQRSVDTLRRGGDIASVRAPRELPLPTLAAALWIVQLSLYLLQENLEARSLGLPPPGLRAITGVHALAPLVHLMVATVVASVLWLVHRRVAALVAEAQTLLATRNWPMVRPALVANPSRPATPVETFGVQLWARPPPCAV